MNFLAVICIIILFLLVFRLQNRLSLAEQQIKRLRQHVALRGGEVAEQENPTPEKAAAPWVIGLNLPERQQNLPEPPPLPAAPLPQDEQREVTVTSAAEPVLVEPLQAEAEPAAPLPPQHSPAPDHEPERNLAQRFEHIFGKMLPIWAGGLTLAIAGVLIVRYAIDAGFFANVFTPLVQVITAMLFGLGLIGGAEYAFRNEDKVRDMRVPQALSGSGLATLFAAILVAANVYMLIGPALAFLGLAAVTAAALGLSLRLGAPSALLGLAGGLAAPAMVGASVPNIPLLALYLALTVAGLAGVSRKRGWTWLAVGALMGGTAWGLALAFTSHAMSALDSLSIGGLILVLAVALPLFAFDGAQRRFLQTVGAMLGALQMALLVANGGFSLLNWGLFILIAAAGQWMAWRDRSLALVPSVGLILVVILLAMWPITDAAHLALIGLPLLAIFAGPLLWRLWILQEGRRPALELCLAAVAPFLLMRWHYSDQYPLVTAALALLGAGLTGAAMAGGWASPNRKQDERFAWLAATSGLLITLALALIVPEWLIVVVGAAVTTGLVSLSRAADDRRIERVAGVFLMATTALIGAQAAEFYGNDPSRLQEFLGWASAALAGIWLASQAHQLGLQQLGQAAGALLGYGAAAVVLPQSPLILLPAIAAAGLLFAAQRWPMERVAVAVGSLALVSLTWAASSIAAWVEEAQFALIGQPMLLDRIYLKPWDATLRMLLPALLFAGGLWWNLDRMRRVWGIAALGAASVVAAMGAHTLYRGAFTAIVGDDLTSSGMAQRLIWAALLMGGAWFAARRDKPLLAWPLLGASMAHILYFSLLWHNPLWSAQAVGPWPLINWLIPLYALPFAGLMLARRMGDGLSLPWLKRGTEWGVMMLVAGLIWSLLRHAFHGSMMSHVGVTDAENILRSILLISLALGYLLWGMKRHNHDWRIASLLLMIAAVLKVFLFDASGLSGLARIASFVALGFSLIGIGWLYSRQLGAGRVGEAAADGGAASREG